MLDEKNYDVVITGTGAIESILSCALARAGKKVLNFDVNSGYGTNFGSLNLKEFIQLNEDYEPPEEMYGNFRTAFSKKKDNSQESTDNSEEFDKNYGNLESKVKEFFENKDENGFFVKYSPNFFFYPTNSQTEYPFFKKSHESDLLSKRIKVISSFSLQQAKEIDKQLLKLNSEVQELQKQLDSLKTEVPSSNPDENQPQNPEILDQISQLESQFQTKKKEFTSVAQKRKKIDTEWRQTIVDFSSQVCYSAGSVIKTLVSSGVGKHLEFRCVDSVLSYSPSSNQFITVPCSKGSVFRSTNISLFEKRFLMKFTDFILKVWKVHSKYNNSGTETVDKHKAMMGEKNPVTDEEDIEIKLLLDDPITGSHFGNFLQALQTHKKFKFELSENLKNIFSAISLIKEADYNEISTIDAVERMVLFMTSMGIYSQGSPFLFPMYGVSEIPQSFARTSAVFGSVFILKCGPVAFLEKKEKQEESSRNFEVLCNFEETVQADHLIFNQDYKIESRNSFLEEKQTKTNKFVDISDEDSGKNQNFMHRIVVFSSKPLFDPKIYRENVASDSGVEDSQPNNIAATLGGCFVAVVPGKSIPTNQMNTIFIQQNDFSSKITQKGKYLTTFQTISSENSSNFFDNFLKVVRFLMPESEFFSNPQQNTNEDPNILFEFYYHQQIRISQPAGDDELSNFYQIDDKTETVLGDLVGLEECFEKAKSIFHKICGPDAQFLPKIVNDGSTSAEEAIANDNQARLLGIEPQKAEQTNQNQNLE